ncbi:MAG: helix-turn-helix transcriptional regulator [Pseudomonadota bacterium]
MKNSSIETLIPSLIRRIRLEKKFSQEDLANLAGLDRTYISGIERGVRNVTLKSLTTILSALEIDAEKFAHELIFESRLNELKQN